MAHNIATVLCLAILQTLFQYIELDVYFTYAALECSSPQQCNTQIAVSFFHRKSLHYLKPKYCIATGFTIVIVTESKNVVCIIFSYIVRHVTSYSRTLLHNKKCIFESLFEKVYIVFLNREARHDAKKASYNHLTQ